MRKSHLINILLQLILSIAFQYSVFSQIDSTGNIELDNINEQIEDFLLENEKEGDFEFNTILEHLDFYREHPQNLNAIDDSQLRDLGLLSDLQIQSFFRYREVVGDLFSIYELQAIPLFDLETIRRILPFVTVNSELTDYQVPVSKMLLPGDNEVYLKWGRILEQKKGFLISPEDDAKKFLGDENKIYVRFKHAYENRLRYGITLEKDPGEEFFRGSNKNGFDFFSAHFYLKDYSSLIKSVAVGDYLVSLGQGLILFNGFGFGKSSRAMDIKKSGRALRPYSSVSENDFFRGGGVTLGLTKKLEMTLFFSNMGRDGNLVTQDTLDENNEINEFSSLQTIGLHRTEAEIFDKNKIHQLSTGGSVKFKGKKFDIALNVLYNKFDKTLNITPKIYNRFYFSGKELLNTSLNYSYIHKNFNFFGETAISDNGGLATLNGVLVSLDRKVHVSVLYRNYARNYQALNASPFGESQSGNNETGLYTGIRIQPNYNWTINAYFDIFKYPWLKFQVDAPSRGYEYLVKIKWRKKRKTDVYVQFKGEVKDRNMKYEDTHNYFLCANNKFQTRLHLSYKVNKSFEVRTRVEFGWLDTRKEEKEQGFLIFQDIIYKSLEFPVSFTTRFALFDTESYSTRFYAYENDLLYNFSIPAYYGKGSRFYFNIRYRPVKMFTFEMRYARSFWNDREVIGSGNDEINAPRKSEVKAQIKIKF